jgi:hypothetical protein
MPGNNNSHWDAEAWKWSKAKATHRFNNVPLGRYLCFAWHKERLLILNATDTKHAL